MIPRLSLALVDREGAPPGPHGARRRAVELVLAVVVITGLAGLVDYAICNPFQWCLYVVVAPQRMPCFLEHNVWPLTTFKSAHFARELADARQWRDIPTCEAARHLGPHHLRVEPRVDGARLAHRECPVVQC